MFNGLVFKKSSNDLGKPEKIFFSVGSIVSNEGMISLELDNRFHLYKSFGKTFVFDINSKKRCFYGDLKLDNSVDVISDKSNFNFDNLVKREILRPISLLDAFAQLNIYDLFVETINSLSDDKPVNHPGLNVLEYLKVTGLNAPLKYEFLELLNDKFYVITKYGSKHLFMENNDLNVNAMRTLHNIQVRTVDVN